MTENYVAPGQQRYLRACMVCSIVMTNTVGHPAPCLDKCAPEVVLPPCATIIPSLASGGHGHANIYLSNFHSASAKRAARTVKNSSTSRDRPSRSRVARRRCSRASSRLLTPKSHGLPGGSGSTTTCAASTLLRSPASCLTRSGLPWRKNIGCRKRMRT